MTNRSADIGASGVASITGTERYRPYPAYKDSGVEWLGEMPTHWEVKQLQWAITFQRGHDLPSEDREEGDVPVVSSSGISSMHSKAVAKAPGIVTGRCGTIGQFYVINQSYWPLNTALYSINFHGNEPRFLFYMLIHMSPLFFLHSIKSAVPAVDRKDVHEEHTAVPHLSEQRAIAAFLDRETAQIDALVAKKERLIELLQEKRTALISHAVTKGLDPDVPLKDSGVEWLGEIPAHWEVKRVSQISEILRGKFTHRPRNDPALYDGPYPFVQTGDVTRARKEITSYRQTLNERGLGVSKMFPSGTLVMTIAANIGDVAVLDFAACFPDSVVGFVPRSGIERDFLFYVFLAMKPELLREAPVNTQGNLNIERIGSIGSPIPVPSESEQHAIAAFLDRETTQIDALIAKVQEAIDRLKELRTALISAAVTGKIDVREAAA